MSVVRRQVCIVVFLGLLASLLAGSRASAVSFQIYPLSNQCSASVIKL